MPPNPIATNRDNGQNRPQLSDNLSSEPLLTKKELATALKVSTKTVERYAKKHPQRLVECNISNRPRFKLSRWVAFFRELYGGADA